MNPDGDLELVALRPLSFHADANGDASYWRPRMVLPRNPDEARLVGGPNSAVEGIWDVWCVDAEENGVLYRSNNVALNDVYQPDGRTESEPGEKLPVLLDGPDARRNMRYAIVRVDRPGTVNDTLSDIRGDHTWTGDSFRDIR